MFEKFKEKAEQVGSEVFRVKNRTEAVTLMSDLLTTAGIADTPGSYALWHDATCLNGIDCGLLSQKIPGLKFSVSRQLAADALVGISTFSYALADTGTLATDQTAVEQRLVSTLCSIHIALVGTAWILPDMPAVFTKMTPASSKYMAFITGPSRTSDIERVLTIGVHGPKRLLIIFIDDMTGSAP